MTTVSKGQLWLFLFDHKGFLDSSVVAALEAADITKIVVAQDMAKNDDLGGDDLITVAEDILSAIRDGYTVVTWYGPDAQTMVAGVRATELTVTDEG